MPAAPGILDNVITAVSQSKRVYEHPGAFGRDGLARFSQPSWRASAFVEVAVPKAFAEEAVE
jgi:hypothetical protein